MKRIYDSDMLRRIVRAEQDFDDIRLSLEHDPVAFFRNTDLQARLACLIEYYDGGLWLHDYQCDERGEIPADLKRGVLSEDGLYNLLSDIQRLTGCSPE